VIICDSQDLYAKKVRFFLINMLKGNKKSGEKVFSELANLGYSNQITYLIWLWYHPKAKCAADVLEKK